MKRFVISYISWFNYELKSEIVEAESVTEATRIALYRLTDANDLDEYITVEQMKQFAFDCDGMVNAIEI